MSIQGVKIMKLQYLSILLIVLSNTFYHLSQKSTPASLSPMVGLIVTYASALIISIVIFFFSTPKVNFLENFKAVNWTSFALGFAVVGLETGFLLAYRSGWNISIVGLLANTIVALVLIPIGLIFYKDTLSFTNIFGVLLCITGLILISKR